MNYPNIDMKKTGIRIKYLLEKSGYTVKQIQEFLCLSCPQPIYRWFKGKNLPSLNHVYALSKLLRVPMEEMLVPLGENQISWLVENTEQTELKRWLVYYHRLGKAA